jgi:menaquinone-dependent protoporphyrinogen oxidase
MRGSAAAERLAGKKEESMPRSVLVAYATKHGSTREVAQALAETLRDNGLQVDTRPAAEVDDVASYEGIVLGGSLYVGRWHPDALRFLERHLHALATLPVAVFAMGPRTAEEHDLADSLAQLERALAKVPAVEPFTVAVFGGVVDPTKLRFPFSRMPASDARDWDAIRAWGQVVAAFEARDPAVRA